MPPRSKLRVVLGVTAAALLSVPAAFVVTFLLYPAWTWTEATFGIESIGHSGPATWCFVAVYCAIAFAVVAGLVARWRRLRAS